MLFRSGLIAAGEHGAAAALARRRDLLPPFVWRFLDWVDRLLQRITRLPSLPRLRRRIRISRGVATCGQYRNPLSAAPSTRPFTMSDAIAYTYDALCALAHDLGVPRPQGQTPYEFLASFPETLDNLKEEAAELTELYVLSAYAGRPPEANTSDRLRRFWLEYERVRRRVLV